MNKLQEICKNIKERLKYQKGMLLFEGILLLVVGIVSLFFDSAIGEITLLFLFPACIIAIAIEVFFFADVYKELDTSRWILLLVEGFLLLLLAVYFILNPVETATMLVKWLGIFIIFKNIMKIIIIPNKVPGEYILAIILMIVGLFFILFPSIVIETLYNIVLIVFIVYGLIKIIWSITLSKLLKGM
ncbi:MAG TPA: DUF308 domain-containing protein [Bacilli bacterium]|nr:DUF308 domain-containing protein [Bacilli bacterium]